MLNNSPLLCDFIFRMKIEFLLEYDLRILEVEGKIVFSNKNIIIRGTI